MNEKAAHGARTAGGKAAAVTSRLGLVVLPVSNAGGLGLAIIHEPAPKFRFQLQT
jgi:hypothetical protein